MRGVNDEKRIVYFAVVSERLTVDALNAALGTPDVEHKSLARFPNQSSWQLRSSGASDAHIGGLVDQVLGRVAPVAEKITRLRGDDPDLACTLQIVGYIEPGPTEPGFGLSGEQVGLLAAVGAFVDADLYYSG
jgi:uncharacterized protein DUF4279